MEAQRAGADYIGVGAVFETPSKSDIIPITPNEVKRITETVKIPAIAIGGITQHNIHRLHSLGLSGIAVISAIFSKENIPESVKTLRDLAHQML